MKESLNNFINNVGDSGLLVMELPTGFGKTYAVKEYVYDFLVGNIKNAPARVFYLTPLKKNIDDVYKDIRKKFEENNKLETFESNVLLLRANYESVIKTLENFNIDDEFTRLDSFKKLKHKVDSYYRQYHQSNDLNNEDLKDIEEQIREEYEPAFRRELEHRIKKWATEKTYAARLKRVNEEFKWLLDAYPAILTNKRKVIITTVDKFYYGNNPIIDKRYRFIVNSITSKSLIFIDESDAAKQKLLSSMIEECTEDKLDTLRVIRCIHHAINNDKVSNDLFKQLPTEDKNKTTIESFRKLRDVFTKLYENNNLGYQFKLEDDDTNSFFLFHDFATTTVISGQNSKTISVKCDEKRNLNVLSIGKDGDNSFNNLIRNLQGAIKFFVNFCNTTAKNVQAYKNDHDKTKTMEIEDAVTSVLNCFNLSETDVKSLSRIVINNYKTPKLEIKNTFLTYDLYDDGFQYFGFENDESHDFNTTIQLSFLNDTPEKFLLTLARRAYVVCFSATAESNSVTGNFNKLYIEENLGNKFYKLPQKKIDELKDYYYRERSKEHNIEVVECTLKDIEKPEHSVFSGAYLEEFETIIAQFKNEKIGKDGIRFYYNRFCRFAIALKLFVQDEKKRIFLAVTNKNLKTRGNEIFRADVIEKVVKLAAKEAKLDSIPSVISLTSTDFDNQKKDYLEKASKGERVILITSYPTASTGQNLQYEIEDEGELKEQDIDTIYVENPTNLLTRITDYNNKADLIRYVYQTLALRSSGELTHNEALSTIEKAFNSMTFSSEKDDLGQQFDKRYGSNSVNNHAVSNIKQAIGRINRTEHKLDTTLFVDKEIISKHCFNDEKGKMQTLEFLKLMDHSDESLKPTSLDELNLKLAVTQCKSSQASINGLMKVENDYWNVSNKEMWLKLRDFVLMHPTSDRLVFEDFMEFKGLYLPSSEKYDGIAYYYAKTDEENNERIEKISYYENPDCKVKFSKGMCNLDKLMTIPEIKKHFFSRGFATDFYPKKYILLPNIMRNIYMGALGEIAGKYVFDHYIKEILIEITDLSKFEKFDFQLAKNNNVYVDFKNWNSSNQKNKEYEEKCSKKLDKIGGKALLIINMFNQDNSKIYKAESDNRIVVIPNIFKETSDNTFIIDEGVCYKIKEFLERF